MNISTLLYKHYKTSEITEQRTSLILKKKRKAVVEITLSRDPHDSELMFYTQISNPKQRYLYLDSHLQYIKWMAKHSMGNGFKFSFLSEDRVHENITGRIIYNECPACLACCWLKTSINMKMLASIKMHRRTQSLLPMKTIVYIP